MGRAQEIETWVTQYQAQSPQSILKLAAQQFDTLALAFSGAEDVVLIDMLHKLKLSQIQVFCLDTGHLHPETYRFLDTVRTHYQLSLEILFPEAAQVEALVKAKGTLSFYQDGHQECCQIRKVKPLQRKLNTVSAWITGQCQN
jgi:phosphoadenosine phosphosulfate reductase